MVVVPSDVSKDKAKNETKRATKGAKQPQNAKHVSIKQRWNKTALHNKSLVIMAALGLAFAIPYYGNAIVQTFLTERHRKEDRRPLVIHSRPPRFLQPLTCTPDRAGGGLIYGNMEIFVKNIKGDTAEQVFPFMSQMKVIPEHKTGDRFWDDIPVGQCDVIPKASPMMFSLVPGEEKSVQIRQGVLTLPPLKKGDTVQLYRVDCVYYSDHEGTQHETCDSYRLSVPSDDPLDRAFGTPSFSCDGTPKAGVFTQTIGGSCAK
jgi:hypothetical protein